MYIHIGEEYSLRAKDIIAILDKDSASSCFVEEFLKQREKELINLSKNPYKSIVITGASSNIGSAVEAAISKINEQFGTIAFIQQSQSSVGVQTFGVVTITIIYTIGRRN